MVSAWTGRPPQTLPDMDVGAARGSADTGKLNSSHTGRFLEAQPSTQARPGQNRVHFGYHHRHHRLSRPFPSPRLPAYAANPANPAQTEPGLVGHPLPLICRAAGDCLGLRTLVVVWGDTEARIHQRPSLFTLAPVPVPRSGHGGGNHAARGSRVHPESRCGVRSADLLQPQQVVQHDLGISDQDLFAPSRRDTGATRRRHTGLAQDSPHSGV